MLSQASREDILQKLGAMLGYPIKEEDLGAGTRQAITNLAVVQQHLCIITEVLRGENSRIQRSLVLMAAARIGRQAERKERDAQAVEIKNLHLEIDAKLAQLADQVKSENSARLSGQVAPGHAGRLEPLELKCPSCGAALPLPMGRFVTCAYCKTTISIQDLSTQMKAMIQSF